MDDWNKLRLLVKIDIWTTRVAWVLAAIGTYLALSSALTGDLPAAGLAVVAVIVSTLVARWHPALVKIDDEETP